MPTPHAPRQTARRAGCTTILAALALFFCLAAAPAAAAGKAGAHAPKGTLVFGMSAAFSGPNSALGVEYSRGILAALAHANARGGAGGWRLELKLRDDRYDPAAALANTIAFVEQERVFALLGYVGTPTTARALPLLKRYAATGVALLFPLTGADLLREPPHDDCVFNLRPSYIEESRVLVEALLAAGHKRIAVFHQSDVYGRNGWDGVRRALAAHGLRIVSEAAYRRGATFAQNFSREAAIIAAGQPDAVVLAGTAPADAAFIRDARDAGLAAVISALSFSDADTVMRLLVEQGRASGRDYGADLVFSQVTPCVENLKLPVVRLYRKVMDEVAPKLPEGLGDGGHVPQRYGAVSLEGFMAGLLLVRAVERAARSGPPTRASLRKALAAMHGVDLGGGELVNFRGGNQALHRTYLSVYSGDRFSDVCRLEGEAK
jgi:ABC-type branched-subunit amino acid transport system substrate-binding protein